MLISTSIITQCISGCPYIWPKLWDFQSSPEILCLKTELNLTQNSYNEWAGMPHLTHTMHTHMQGSALQTVKKFQKILLFLPIPAYLKLGGTRGKFLKTQSDLEKRAFYNPFFFPHVFCCRHPSLSCPSTFLLPQRATWQTGEHELHSSILTLSSNIRATHLKRGTRLFATS